MKQSKALGLMKTNKSVKERAESYAVAIQRNIQRDVIDKLVANKEKLDDEKFELTNFNLQTNLNAGERQMTKEDCEKRFKRLIDIEYELALLTVEIRVKTTAFESYFN